MAFPKFRLLPACHDDGGTSLNAFDPVAGGYLQFVKIVRAEVRQRMSLEPSLAEATLLLLVDVPHRPFYFMLNLQYMT
jgi:hypothetical protein